MYISDFYLWKTNRLTLFCNLFIERPGFLDNVSTALDEKWNTYSPRRGLGDLLLRLESNLKFTLTSKLLTAGKHAHTHSFRKIKQNKYRMQLIFQLN